MARHDRRGLLFVTPWLRNGGIERVLQVTVPWLARRGYRCEVASCIRGTPSMDSGIAKWVLEAEP